ncbi:MAG: glycolate oxidase subunit GlcD, partial [Bacteroidetes bacterium]|nr:glycolate oxidase subunit GlcD [Bacteroidota bacterium]
QGLAQFLIHLYEESDREGIPVAVVMHAGDGNLHPNFLFDSRNSDEVAAIERLSKQLMEAAIEAGGTLSGEHGIGNDKSKYMPMHLGKDGIRMQLAVSKAFNGIHQLNPLKIFQERSYY